MTLAFTPFAPRINFNGETRIDVRREPTTRGGLDFHRQMRQFVANLADLGEVQMGMDPEVRFAASVHGRAHERWGWVLFCSCGMRRNHSTLGYALETLREHLACEWCDGHCIHFCYGCGGCCEFWCDECNGHCNYCESCDGHCDYYCGDCDGHCRCGDLDGLHEYLEDYGFKPDPIFFPSRLMYPRERYNHEIRSFVTDPDGYVPKPGFPHIGMELEVSWDDTTNAAHWLQTWNNHMDFWYAKSDSTVSNGFELVTHPFQPRWALEGHFPFDVIEDGLNSGAYESDPSCGTHIHIERAALTGRQLWVIFKVHRELARFCGVVGGRGTNSSWANWGSDDVLDKPLMVATKKGGSHGRYLPINVPEHADTLELRYPRGGFSEREIRKNIEWIEALLSFGQGQRGKELQVDELALTRHIYRGDWPNLQRHLHDNRAKL